MTEPLTTRSDDADLKITASKLLEIAEPILRGIWEGQVGVSGPSAFDAVYAELRRSISPPCDDDCSHSAACNRQFEVWKGEAANE